MKARLYILHSDLTEDIFNDLNEVEKENIIISSDEITHFNMKLEPHEESYAVPVMNLTLNVKGRVIGGINENDEYELKDIKNDFLENRLELGSSWNQVEEKYLTAVKETVKSNYSSIDFRNESLTDNIVHLSLRNLKKLNYWSSSYYKSDYRTVILEIENGESHELQIFENMYLSDFTNETSIETGTGDFSMKVRQKENSKTRYKNHYSTDGNKVPIDLTEGVQASEFQGRITKNATFELNGEEYPLLAGAGAVGVGSTIATTEENKKEIEVRLFDVGDPHVQFLLGKRESTPLYTSKITEESNKELYDFLNSQETFYTGYKKDINILFGEKKEITKKDFEEDLGQLEKLENINQHFYTTEEIAKFPTGNILLANSINNALANVVVDNFSKMVELKVAKKLQGKSSILPEDYFLYKVEKEGNKHLIIGMSKETHYGRNKYQIGKIPTTKFQLKQVLHNNILEDKYEEKFKIEGDNQIPSNIFYYSKQDMFYNKLSKFKSIYHGVENEKFVSMNPDVNKTGMYEVVYSSSGSLIKTSEELGTFNFYSPSKEKAHTLYDVVPYWLWGNTEKDSTLLPDRLSGLSKWPSLVRYYPKRVTEKLHSLQLKALLKLTKIGGSI